jgi:RNA recognition motif-containing protein
MDIFVGSIPFKLKDEDLRTLFEKYGEVASAKIIIDKITRQNKGFGFVEMPNDDEAKAAIDGLNGYEIEGRTINVSKSEPKEKTGGFGGKGGGFNKGKNPFVSGGGGFGGRGGGFKGSSKGFSKPGFNRKSS